MQGQEKMYVAVARQNTWGHGYYGGGVVNSGRVVVTGMSDHGNICGFGDKMEQTCENNGRVHECMEYARG